ncbi:NADP-dependent oxidoreductase domain-containing protein [Melampsora americana]|nr:NADP-dependent oxidoreductase domain-containing protein [Melampsora americana]
MNSNSNPKLLNPDEPLRLSSIIFGAATFSESYNDSNQLKSEIPEKTLLKALRSGINAIDTSPYYFGSESILGKILSKPEIQLEFPRHTYHLLTKCGRYGPKLKDFDYTPNRIRHSIEESCKLMYTSYLDVVYLHDIEFIAEEVKDLNLLTHQSILEHQIESLGKGDEIILEAIQTLFQLKQEGKIKKVGISGYPLPTLLRISQLINFKLRKPLDILMSYSHYNLQNRSLLSFLPLFHQSGIHQIINASPFSMGLLTTIGPQAWHPAPDELKSLCHKISQMCEEEYQIRLEKVALRFGIRKKSRNQESLKLMDSIVIGFSSVKEVEECIEIRDEVWKEDEVENQIQLELELENRFKESGYLNWSWPTPDL